MTKKWKNFSVSKQKGFSLMEVMLTILIMTTMLGLAATSIRGRGLQAREDALRTQLELTRAALGRYAGDLGCSAISIDDLLRKPEACMDDRGAKIAADASRWRGPYLPFAPADPVSNGAFKYDPSDPGGRVSSSTAGNDSQGVPYSSY